MAKLAKIIIIMPAYNEQAVIGQVIAKAKQFGYQNIVVINDGSTDNTAKVARQAGALVLSHPINRGLGAALATGFAYARAKGADIAVTLDSDGQHEPAEIGKLIQPILDGQADVVIGSRLKNPAGMPWYRLIGNWFLNLVTWFFFGIFTTDSQSGLRAFSKLALRRINILTSRMEVSSEIFHEIKAKNLRFAEVAIRPIYSHYSLRKGQSNFNAISIIRRLIFKALGEI